MKCQKCGASLPEGGLYCQKCGDEYQIVPDFEPELENSIAQTMSSVGHSIVGEHTTTILKDKESIKEEKDEKKKWIYSGAVLLASLIILGILGAFFYLNSVFYLYNQARKAVNEENYKAAMDYYDELRRKEPENTEWYIEEAKLELLYGDQDTAKQLAYRAINETSGNYEIYMFLIELLIYEESYQEIYEVLKNCPYEKIVERYREYHSFVGTLSHDGGSYYSIVELSLKDSSKYVYYTTDGSIPDRNSHLYLEPIVLGNGTHTITFLSYNDFGVMGELIRKEYTVHTSIPTAPNVWPEEEVLEEPEVITVTKEPGCRIFYTTDGSIPDTDSFLYEEPIPIPIGESNYVFIAISEKNEKSNLTKRSYKLNLRTEVSIDEAEKILVDRLIETGHILDNNGAIKDRYGVFRYFYKFPVKAEGRSFYVFEEHYLENLIDNPLGNYYGVDITNREVIPLKKDFLGKYYPDVLKN